MLKVIKNEFFKMFNGRKIYILNMLVILCMVINEILSKKAAIQTHNSTQIIFSSSIFNVAMKPLLPVVMVIIVAEIFTEDYIEGTMKFTLMTGIKRSEIVLGKLISLAAYAVIFVTVTFIFTYISQSIIYGTGLNLDLIYDLKVCISVIIPLICFSIVVSLAAIIINNNGMVIAVGIIAYVIMMIFDISIKNLVYFSFSGGMYGYGIVNNFTFHTVLVFTLTAFIYIIVFSVIDLLIIEKKDFLL